MHEIASISTKEETQKISTIPIIEALGYDIENPLETQINYPISVYGEIKYISYALTPDDSLNPKILIETKAARTTLTKEHAYQLAHCYMEIDAQIAVLTNGLSFEIFFNEHQLMDHTPVAILYLNRLDDAVDILQYIKKDTYDPVKIRQKKEEFALRVVINRNIEYHLSTVSNEFINLVVKQHYKTQYNRKNLTPADIKKSRAEVQLGLERFLSRERLDTSFDGTFEVQDEDIISFTNEEIIPDEESYSPEEEEDNSLDLVSRIVSNMISPERLFLRVNRTYTSILVDDNNRKPLCRLFFRQGGDWKVKFPPFKKAFKIWSVEDLYSHAGNLQHIAALYDA